MSEEKSERVMRVKASTPVGSLAGAIKSLYDKDNNDVIILRCVGAGVCNQALKAVVICNQFLAKDGKICWLYPSFTNSKEKLNGSTQDVTITVIELVLQIKRIA